MNLSGTNLILLLGTLIISMALHEAVHAFTAHWLGDDTASEQGRLTLNPLKHIDLFTTILVPFLLITAGLPPIFAAKPVPFNPNRVRFDEYGAALVGIAGPLTNLALAIVAAFVLRVGNFYPGSLAVDGWFTFLQVNIAMFIFNMIPIPPLDGSRLLYAFAPEPLQKVMEQIESIGIIGILIVLFVLLQFIGPVLTEANEALLRLLL